MSLKAIDRIFDLFKEVTVPFVQSNRINISNLNISPVYCTIFKNLGSPILPDLQSRIKSRAATG